MKQAAKKNTGVAESKRKLSKGIIGKPAARVREGADPEHAPQMDWKSELADLTAGRYSSIDQAISAVVSKVVGRMKLSGAEKAETIEFLTLMFQTDEELKRDIASNLKIS